VYIVSEGSESLLGSKLWLSLHPSDCTVFLTQLAGVSVSWLQKPHRSCIQVTGNGHGEERALARPCESFMELKISAFVDRSQPHSSLYKQGQN
jgi:hypothetical protein